MNKFQILVILAGIFQILSQGFDQFVIQQEQKVRKIENSIEKNKEVSRENTNGGLTYGQVYLSLTDQIDINLKIKDENITNSLLKTQILETKDKLLTQINILLNNPNIKKNDISEGKYMEPFNNINSILKNNNDLKKVSRDLRINFTETGQILEDLYEFNEILKKQILDLEQKLKQTISSKFTFLVIGMICNIFSIFFILVFFYMIIINQINQKKKINTI